MKSTLTLYLAQTKWNAYSTQSCTSLSKSLCISWYGRRQPTAKWAIGHSWKWADLGLAAVKLSHGDSAMTSVCEAAGLLAWNWTRQGQEIRLQGTGARGQTLAVLHLLDPSPSPSPPPFLNKCEFIGMLFGYLRTVLRNRMKPR